MEVSQAHRQVTIDEASQTSEARYAARDAAEVAGFAEGDVYRAGLIATELATNLVKHAAGGGELLVRCLRGRPRGEMELIAIDRGPGMHDVGRSMVDGHSTAGTSGTGLGAVRRLADAFDIYSQDGRGTVVLARLRERPAAPAPALRLVFAGVSVAKKNEILCGDAWQVFHDSDGALAVVADGLGHGEHASRASAAALATVDPQRALGLTDRLQHMHDGLRHTRGAAVAIAEIQISRRLLKYAGIGNISGTIDGEGVTRHAVSLNGTLGHEVRRFQEYTYPWPSDALFVMHSDGLTSHWSLNGYRGLRSRHPAVVAAVLYRDFSRQRDDVTVVVGREAA
jgi:anti-sigma regulatory factor (Ser/Thr protein kinase)